MMWASTPATKSYACLQILSMKKVAYSVALKQVDLRLQLGRRERLVYDQSMRGLELKEGVTRSAVPVGK